MAKLLVYNGKLVTNSGRLVSYSGSTPPAPAKLVAPEVVSAPYLATIGYNLNNNTADVNRVIARVRLRSSANNLQSPDDTYDNSFYISEPGVFRPISQYDDITTGSYMLPLQLAVSVALNNVFHADYSSDQFKMYAIPPTAWNGQGTTWSSAEVSTVPQLLVDGAGGLLLTVNEDDAIESVPNTWHAGSLMEIMSLISLRSYESDPTADPEAGNATGFGWYLTDSEAHALLGPDRSDWDIIEISLKAISANSALEDSDWSVPFNLMNNDFYTFGTTSLADYIARPYVSLRAITTLAANVADQTDGSESSGIGAYCYKNSDRPWNSWTNIGYTVGPGFVFSIPLLEDYVPHGDGDYVCTTGLIPGGWYDYESTSMYAMSAGCIAFVPSDKYTGYCPYTTDHGENVYLPYDMEIVSEGSTGPDSSELRIAIVTDHEQDGDRQDLKLNLYSDVKKHKLGEYIDTYGDRYVPMFTGCATTEYTGTEVWDENADLRISVVFE